MKSLTLILLWHLTIINLFAAIDERTYNLRINHFYSVYQPIMQSLYPRNNFIINRDWDEETVNMETFRSRIGHNFIVNAYGGLARHPLMTEDAFSLILCHEIGHHLGGDPFYPLNGLSTEGQSDYYAATVCAKLIFDSNLENYLVYINNQDNREYQRFLETCSSSLRYHDIINQETEVYRCARIIKAGHDLALFFRDTSGLHNERIFTHYTPSFQNNSLDYHPLPNCRFQTYRAGALCPRASQLNFDHRQGTNRFNCENPDRFTHRPESRPRCWFGSPR